MIDMPHAHVPFQWLADRSDGRLRGRRREWTDAHLAGGCTRCSDDLRLIGRITRALSSGPLDTAPEAEVQRAVGLYLRTMPFLEDPDIDWVEGTVLLDQRTEMVAAVRHAPGDTRRLPWSLGDYEVDACVVSGPTTADLLGQILPPEDDPEATLRGHVTVYAGREEHSRVDLEADGRFTFRGLAPGAYVLEGRVDAVRFFLPTLVID